MSKEIRVKHLQSVFSIEKGLEYFVVTLEVSFFFFTIPFRFYLNKITILKMIADLKYGKTFREEYNEKYN